MTYLDAWRNAQNNDLQLASDAQLQAFLTTVNPAEARLDLYPRSYIEAAMLARWHP